jgi:type I site-specific restriction endonuclease
MEIFDPMRRKFVRLTAEEWVRQHFLNYLTGHKGYPSSLIAVEASLAYNRLVKRSDILVHGPNGKPLLVVECKAPEVELTQAVFDQVALYNMSLMVGYVVVTNGLEHFACRINHENHNYSFLEEIPDFGTLTK